MNQNRFLTKTNDLTTGRWMLDNDFCDINRLAAKHLEASTSAAKHEDSGSDFGEDEEQSKSVSFVPWGWVGRISWGRVGWKHGFHMF